MECVENVLRTQREREAEIINKDKKEGKVKCKNYRGICQQNRAHKMSPVTIKAK